KRVVVLGSEAHIRKEMTHAMAMAAQRVQLPVGAHQPVVAAHQPSGAHAAAAANGTAAARINGSAAAAAPAAPHTPAEIAAAAAEAGNYSLKDISREAARQAERELIFKMLQHTRWNRKETAEILGISYKALLYKIK